LFQLKGQARSPFVGAKEHAARDDRTIRQGLEYHMERKRDAFKAKLSAAPIGRRFERIAGSRGGIFGAVKLDKSTHLVKH
jgi:hypothetical protein